jgi:hypothetical protein
VVSEFGKGALRTGELRLDWKSQQWIRMRCNWFTVVMRGTENQEIAQYVSY